MDVIGYIRQKQEQFTGQPAGELPEHKPEMLLIGCVDARLDIVHDIGMPKGKVLIKRNIAALIAGTQREEGDWLCEAATLEFAVDVMQVKHVVVMGHTDCGGIRARVEELDRPHIKRYLEPLDMVHEQIALRGGSRKLQAEEMERAAVRLSLKNLRSYKNVKEAEQAKKVMLHGWIVDTATKQLHVLDEPSGTFLPMIE